MRNLRQLLDKILAMGKQIRKNTVDEKSIFCASTVSFVCIGNQFTVCICEESRG